MKQYYAARAGEYEDIYRRPERQEDLRWLEGHLSHAFAGLDVLEVACGTGYWTQFIARSARSIHATDVNPEVLELARKKEYGSCEVEFAVADAFAADPPHRHWNGAFHGFWWSHLAVEKNAAFLRALHSKCLPGAKVVMIDNRFVPGSSTPISRTDRAGNTYQRRFLKDGSEHEVRKNFPAEHELRALLRESGRHVEVRLLPYYWLATYEVGG